MVEEVKDGGVVGFRTALPLNFRRCMIDCGEQRLGDGAICLEGRALFTHVSFTDSLVPWVVREIDRISLRHTGLSSRAPFCPGYWGD